MLLPEDDFPLHQAPVPLAHSMGGHPNAYDRFWFNGLADGAFFAVALGLYPQRGVIDGAFAVVEDGIQRSVFTSDALVDRRTHVGPLSIEIVEPLRVNRITLRDNDFGLRADLTYRALTATIEEPRQTMYDGSRIFMDVTRATQMGHWEGWIETPAGRRDINGVVGTKDRSWGVRPVGEPLPGAPSTRAPQLAFQWGPLFLGESAVHVMSFDDAAGRHLHHSAGILPLEGPAQHVSGELTCEWQPGTRWMSSGQLIIDHREFRVTPVGRFHMRGAGYSHPTYAHGRWHGGLVIAGETLTTDELDPLEYHNIHVQHIVSVDGPLPGVGVVEQLIIGPYAPAGVTGLLDGVPSP
ncbi:MAG: hypothetical protein KJS64_00030 [Acidobacteria bacterium]|nr:hypothetical protein [Acidobacteriota bacterium]